MCAATIIDGRQISNEIATNLIGKIEWLKKYSIIPTLAVILVGSDPASHVYVASKIKRAKQIGIEVKSYFFDETVIELDLILLIKNLNIDDKINGILVQLPLANHINSHKVINSIDHGKDVDGFTVTNVGLLNTWQDCLEPSTPQAAMILIKQFMGRNLAGLKAVVLGRSLIVGRPMTSMLIKENCTVTLLHSQSINIAAECKTADIVVSAIGKPKIIDSNFIKKGACVIDIGITRINDKLFGDVNLASVNNIAGFITPVPGGVGPMTVICMLNNTIKACLNQNGLN